MIEKLEYAKKAVLWLLNNPDGSVDFHDLVYWAGEVVRIRAQLKSL